MQTHTTQTQTNCHSEILKELVRGDTSILQLLYDYGILSQYDYERAKAIVLAHALYYIQYRDIESFSERLNAIVTDLGLPRDTVINYLWKYAEKFRSLMIKTYGKVDHRKFQPRKNKELQ